MIIIKYFVVLSMSGSGTVRFPCPLQGIRWDSMINALRVALSVNCGNNC